MVRFVRLLAAAALAAGLASAANAQGVPMQEGPMETGPLQSGPSPPAKPAKAKEGRARRRSEAGGEEAGAGRPADHRPRPAVLSDRRHGRAGRLGRQRLCARHFQPGDADRGDLFGHARPGAAYRPVREPGTGPDAVQVLGRREQRLDGDLEPGRIQLDRAVGKDARLDRIPLPALVVDRDPPLRIED